MTEFLLHAKTPDLPQLEFCYTTLEDELAQFMLSDLQSVYDSRYESQANAPHEKKEINSVPAEDFTAEATGAFLLLLSEGQAVGGGAIMKCRNPIAEENSAEFKRIWTHPDYRGKGIGKFVLNELEFEAVRLGYDHIFLTTGPAQPEAVGLYQSLGYIHLPADSDDEHLHHAFKKPLAEHRALHEAGQRTRGEISDS
ncbi:GNAT family N-acetyltransferase [Rothia sp. LK2588]|uniref:GNAT family N-acetyltransferase n=1 Tax=Rothia sp. LK2588 TaxID=3114369 RepID=UPI0034CFD007